jgi:predicted adenylyl cyclase CyaB
MKQIEVTVKVKNTLEEIDELLTSKGFKLIRKSRVEDDYVCPKELKVDKNNILEVLSSCVLIRYLKTAEAEFKKLTYKNKEYSKDGVVISEEKINVSIDDTKKAQELFEKINFKKLVSVHYDVIVYSNNNYEFAFQDVEGLGLLLEFENENDFEGVSDETIVSEKQKMYEIIKTYGIKVENNYDIKKAYELVMKKIELAE